MDEMHAENGHREAEENAEYKVPEEAGSLRCVRVLFTVKAI